MTPLSKQELRKQIRELFEEQTDYLKAHDPLVDQAMALLDTYCEQREVEAVELFNDELIHRHQKYADSDWYDPILSCEDVTWVRDKKVLPALKANHQPSSPEQEGKP